MHAEINKKYGCALAKFGVKMNNSGNIVSKENNNDEYALDIHKDQSVRNFRTLSGIARLDSVTELNKKYISGRNLITGEYMILKKECEIPETINIKKQKYVVERELHLRFKEFEKDKDPGEYYPPPGLLDIK